MPINLARIDDRLIHGQVVTTWVRDYQIEQILIINDKVAVDKVQQSILNMSAPAGVKVLVFGVNHFIEVLKKTEIKKNTMLLFTTSTDVLTLLNNGLTLDKLNVGGMRMINGRKSLSRAVSVTKDEEEAFHKILEKGVTVEVQMVPKDPITMLNTILK